MSRTLRTLPLLPLLSIALLFGCGGSSNSSTTPPPPGDEPTTLALAVSPNPATAGAAVTLTATISAASGIPTGSISFLDGATPLGTAALSGTAATYTTSTLAAGTHSLTAAYSGGTGYSTSTSTPVSLTVSPAPPAATTLALTVSPNPAASGAAVTLTATISAASGTPTGSVSFLDGTATLGTGTLSGNTATYTTSTLAAGTHSLTAAYAATTTFAASASAPVSLTVEPPFTTTAAFSFATPHQTIAGFGGAEAFYGNYLDNHPNESQIMTALFDPVKGLGITFLRLQNNYYQFTGSNASTFDTDNTRLLQAANAALGSPVTLELSSWTPPASLKSNASVDGCTGSCNTVAEHGTLHQVGGAYDYAGFAQFWLSSLQAYAALGVTPQYISIQNEPDFPAGYVGCLFNPTETPTQLYDEDTGYASYGKAFDAVYQALHASSLASVPAMIGPEAFSLSNVSPLLTQVPPAELAAVAHHLYNVPSAGGNPAQQVTPMTALAAAYPTDLKFETEYFQSPGFSNAIDLHNALTVAGDSVYLYWGLTWPSTLSNGISSDQAGLLYIDNPFNAQSTWAFPSGWAYNDAYYTMKHYSYFIRPGYIRYDASSTNPDEAISVFQSPDRKTTVVVVLNTSSTSTDTVGLNLTGISYTNSAVYRSSFATPITATGAERWDSLGAYNPNLGIAMPPQSAVTVALTN